MGDDRKMLHAEDVCKMMDVSIHTVWRLVKEDKIPYLRFGRAVRFPSDALKNWLDARTVMPVK